MSYWPMLLRNAEYYYYYADALWAGHALATAGKSRVPPAAFCDVSPISR